MKLWVSNFMLAGVLGSVCSFGCGRSDTIYSDDGDNLVVIEHSSLPAGFYDQSINRADAMTADGSLRLRLRGGDSAAGSFADATLTGSRAVVGLGGYDSTKLADFKLHVESTSTTTTSIRISLNVDLKCDGGTLHTIESSVGVGSSDLAADVSPLSEVLADNPDACLKNGLGDAADAPASIPLASVQLSIGSGTSTSVEEVSISSLELNGDTYSSWSL